MLQLSSFFGILNDLSGFPVCFFHDLPISCPGIFLCLLHYLILFILDAVLQCLIFFLLLSRLKLLLH